MFKINNLSVNVNDKKLLENLDLQINDGEVHIIMGKNGIGKSSLCKVLLKDPNYNILGGNINYLGKNILDMNTSDIAKEGIMLINQHPIAIEGVSNAELLRAALREKEDKKINIFEFNKKLEDACTKLDLDKGFIHKDVNVGASGGERKKIELLHLAMLEPKFIILDEIDSGLDVDALKKVADFINDYHNKSNCSILMITHHPAIINYIKPNYVHILDDGKIVKTGDHHLAYEIEQSGFGTVVMTEDDSGE